MLAGFDVPMNQVGRVSSVQRAGDLRDQIERAGGLQLAIAAEQLPEVGALDVGHRQVEPSFLLPEAQDRDDVGVIEARCKLGLPHEPLAKALVLGELRSKELQRDALPRSSCPPPGKRRPLPRCPMSDSTRKPARMVPVPTLDCIACRQLGTATPRIYQRRQEAVPSTASCCAPEITEREEPGSARSSGGACGATRA